MEAIPDEGGLWRRLVEHLHDGFSLLTADGVHLDVNPALCAMTRFSREELVGAGPPHPYWPPEAYGAVQAAFEKTLGGKTETFPLTFMRKDGERFPVLVTPSVVRDADGAVVSAFATVKDMTALRQAEAALVESERLFRLTFDQAPIGAALVELDFRFSQVNGTFCRMTGYRPEELLTMRFPEITHPGDAAIDEPQIKRLAAGEIVEYAREKRYVRKNGSIAWGDVVMRPVLGDDDRPFAFIAMVNDITERRAAEAALRESEERFRIVQDVSPDGFTILRPVRDAQSRVVDFTWVYENATIARLNGTDPQAVVGQRLLTLFPDHEESQFLKAYKQVAETGEPCIFEDEYRGETITASTCFRIVVVPAGQDIAILAQDVTERRHAEDEVRRLNAELEQRIVSRTAQRDALNRELEAFAYSASHDLRAPLRAIDGFSAMVAEDAAERLTVDDLDHLQRVRSAAQRMGQLIDDILGLSRVTRGNMLRATVDVSALAGEVAKELRAENPGRSVAFRAAPDMRAQADAALLRVILYQLLGNAWKFSSKHETASIEVGVTDEGGQATFFVRDDGAGFDMAYAEHIFGAFQRFHPAGEYPGDGIGLATVQRLVLRHGGRVWAETEIEKGATFFFTLPDEAKA